MTGKKFFFSNQTPDNHTAEDFAKLGFVQFGAHGIINNWMPITERSFDWDSYGKYEFKREDGSTVFATLHVETLFTDDLDEIPVFELKLEDGSEAFPHQFAEYRRIRP